MDAVLGSDAVQVARRLHEADTVVVLTSAGISTTSGISDPRDDDGIREAEFDPASFHRDRFIDDPAGFWRDRVHLQECMFPDGVRPNPGHEVLSVLESQGVLGTAVTQNIDGLYRKAGFDRVVELHGNAVEVVCEDCNTRTDVAPVSETVRTGGMPPACDDYGGLLESGVALSDERLLRVACNGADRLAGDTDVFPSLGSSLTAYPTTSLAGRAAGVGSLVVADPGATQYGDRVGQIVRDDLVAFLPEVERRI